MTTPVWLTGFEYGLATPVVSGGGLASLVTGAVSIQSTQKHSGTYALAADATAATAYIAKSFTAGQYCVGRVYFRTTNLSAGWIVEVLGTIGPQFFYVDADARMHIFSTGDTSTYSTTTIAVDTWVRLDFIVDGTAGTVDWQINGTAEAQHTFATTGNCSSIRIGQQGASATTTYHDDIIISATAADYPIGAGEIEGLRPGSDGTHNNAANIMEDSAGNDIDGSSVFAFDKLNEDPWTSTANAGYVRQTDNGTGNYCEINFADTTKSTIVGAMALLEYASATATANTGGCVLIDEDATVTTLWGVAGTLADYSESSAFYKSVMMPVPTGGWDAAAVNAIKCRFGYSGDADPDPYWLALMLEVAYIPSQGATQNGEASLAAYAATTTAAQVTYNVAAQLLSYGSLTTTSQVTYRAAAAISAANSLSVAGGLRMTGAAVANAYAALTAEAIKRLAGSAALASFSALSSDGYLDLQGAASVTAYAALISAAQLTQQGNVALNALTNLVTSGRLNISAAVISNAYADLLATGGATGLLEITLATVGALSVNGRITAQGQAALNAYHTLMSIASVTRRSNATLDGANTLDAGGYLILRNVLSLAASGSIGSSAQLTTRGAASLDAFASLSGEGGLSGVVSAILAAAGLLSVDGRLIARGVAALNAYGSFSISSGLTVLGAALLNSYGALDAAGGLRLTNSAALNAYGVTSVNGRLIVTSDALLNAINTLTGSGALVARGNALLDTRNTLGVNGYLNLRGAALLDAINTMQGDASLKIVMLAILNAYGGVSVLGALAVTTTDGVFYASLPPRGLEMNTRERPFVLVLPRRIEIVE